jgi:hypothetical protein
MKNREAIKVLEWIKNTHPEHITCEAIDLAVSALEKQEQERWRPTAEKEPDVNCLACDKFGQIFIPQCGIINITAGNKRKSFDCPADFDVSDINAFFNGKEVGNGMRILPKEILAWRPLPEPYTEEES